MAESTLCDIDMSLFRHIIHQAVLPEAVHFSAAAGDYDVIDHPDIQDLASLCKLLGNGFVVVTGLRVSAWMLVENDEGRAVA